MNHPEMTVRGVSLSKFSLHFALGRDSFDQALELKFERNAFIRF